MGGLVFKLLIFLTSAFRIEAYPFNNIS